MNYRKVKNKRGQKESILQREIIDALNASGLGYFFRIRNGATFDPVAKVFRANTGEKGISDIIGCRKDGRACFMEVKFYEVKTRQEKLLFSNKVSKEQKDFLKRMESNGALVGVVYDVEDALAVVYNNPEVHIRKPRTYQHLDDSFLEPYSEKYKEMRAKKTDADNDPIQRMLAKTKGFL